MEPAHTEVRIDVCQNEGEKLRVPHVALIIAALEAVQVLAEAHDTRILSLLVQLYSLKTTETSSVHSVRSSISTEDVAPSVSEAVGQVLVKLAMKLRHQVSSGNATGDASKLGRTA